jgi:hypothetical protein
MLGSFKNPNISSKVSNLIAKLLLAIIFLHV